MLFNSTAFLIFLPIVFGLYWLVFARRVALRNLFLVAASYVFYGWWDWRFLILIVVSSVVDYLAGRALGRWDRPLLRRAALLTSLAVNLGFLFFFKYYDFFVESLVAAFAGVGITLNTRTLGLILPVGISFYTFQTLSYTIDVYRRQMDPTKDILAFFAFVSFFPQLVAGPIERAKDLLPQFYTHRRFDAQAAHEGLLFMLWGLFKKMVVADNCAPIVDEIFANYESLPPPVLALGTVLFAFQIYGDFSGYSDIAIGTARLFGFSLMVNFRQPYFSRDIAEFWRRWHISLSTWFRDYLYIPLGGSRGGPVLRVRNVMAIFLISGLWHGANWTFVVWGLLNALFFLPLLLWGRNRRYLDAVARESMLPSARELFQMLTNFALVCLAWIFFRAQSIDQAWGYLLSLFRNPWGGGDYTHLYSPIALLGIFALLVGDWIGRREDAALMGVRLPPAPRLILFAGLALCIILLSPSEPVTFIYFQF